MTLLQQNSLSETGFKAYTTYLALKRHFTSSYDYHKYNGKVNASFESFSIRKDAFTFQRLGKQRDFEGLILSNIVIDKKVWAGNLLDDSCRQIYLDWKKRQDSITHHFKSSLSILDEDFKSNFIVHNGQYPHLVDLHLQKRISMEVFAVLVKLTNSKPYWDEKVVDKVIFPDIMTKIDKYIPFINYSNEKMSSALKDHFF
jgi:hypothetical protein